MRFQIIGYKYHDFVPIKSQGNVVLAKCTCCSKPRLAVYVQTENRRIYFFNGYSEQIAEIHFNSLIKRLNSQSQD